MYAIINKRTKKWLYGTWWQNGRIVQRTSEDNAKLFEWHFEAETEFKRRCCGKDYKIVPVRLEILED